MNKHDLHIELLKKLVAGNISDSEKWILEKASLDDPFLADALEGFYQRNEKNNTKVNLPTRRRQLLINSKWWKVAASFLVLIGAALVFNWMVLDNNMNKQASVMVFEEAQEKELIKEPPIPESSETSKEKPQANDNGIDIVQVETSKQGTKHKHSSRSKKRVEGKRRDERIEETSKFNQVDIQDDVDQVFMDEIANVEAIANKSIKGVIRTTDGFPINGADLYTPDRSIRSSSDQGGNFLMNLREDDSLIIAAYTGYDTQVVPATENLTIELQKAALSMSQPSKSKKALMTDSEIKANYKEEIDNKLDILELECLDPGDEKKYETVPIEITIDVSGEVSKIDFLKETTTKCTGEIETIILELNDDEIFESDRPVRFIYHLKIK